VKSRVGSVDIWSVISSYIYKLQKLKLIAFIWCTLFIANPKNILRKL
jgi:hypothetical protein